jgi:hypothetical protein
LVGHGRQPVAAGVTSALGYSAGAHGSDRFGGVDCRFGVVHRAQQCGDLDVARLHIDAIVERLAG